MKKNNYIQLTQGQIEQVKALGNTFRQNMEVLGYGE
jgi:hypothetical protein